MRKVDMVVKGLRGGAVLSPLSTALNMSGKQFKSIVGEFGLSLVSRVWLAAEPAKPADPFEEYLRGEGEVAGEDDDDDVPIQLSAAQNRNRGLRLSRSLLPRATPAPGCPGGGGDHTSRGLNRPCRDCAVSDGYIGVDGGTSRNSIAACADSLRRAGAVFRQRLVGRLAQLLLADHPDQQSRFKHAGEPSSYHKH